MSTRALYTFHDERSSWNVYKHHDGYPSGAAEVIRTAIDYFAWQLPRFEADEFAAAFCAAGKSQHLIKGCTGNTQSRRQAKKYFPGGEYRRWTGGGVRFMPQGDPARVAQQNCADIEYRYELMMGTGGKKLIIKAFASSGGEHERVIFYGPFHDFERAAGELDCVGPTYSIYAERNRKRRAPIVQHESIGRPA